MSERRVPVGAALAALCLFAVLLVPWWGQPMDDAFISLRYAANVAAGRGLVFNPGERVEGFSDPLWIALLAVARLAGADLVRAAQALGVACAAATVALSAIYLRPRGRWAVAGALAVAAHPTLLVWAGRGLEGPLFGLLVVGANVLLESGARRGRAHAGFFALAVLLALTRPEGVAWAMLLGALGAPGVRPEARRAYALGCAAAGALLAGAIAARYGYYGSLAPNTYHAKMVATGARLEHGARYVLDFLATPANWGVPLAVALSAGAAWRLRRAVPGSILRLAAQVALGLGLAGWMGGDWMPAHRFLAPVAALAALLAAEALAALRPSPPRLHVAVVVAAQTALALSALAWGRLPADLDFYRAQVGTYARVGRWFARHTPPEASVACDAIGAIGYFGDRRVVDFYGLIDPAIAALPANHPESPPGHQKYDVARSLARSPDYVVLNAALLLGRPVARLDDLLALYPPGFLYGDVVRSPVVRRDYAVTSIPIGAGWLPVLARRR